MANFLVRNGSFRITAVPTAGQSLLVQLGPLSDGEFIATNVIFAAAPADASAAALVVVNAVNVLAPDSLKVGHIGEGIVAYQTYDQSPGFTCSLSGNVSRTQHLDRYTVVPDEVRYEGLVAREVEVADPAAVALGAGVGLALGLAFGRGA